MSVLTCGDCADYSCDKSGGRLRTDKACGDFFKPWEFTSKIEDADDSCPGVITFQKYGSEMKCIIEYPVSDDQHQTETIEFKELDNSTINSISKKVFELCNVDSPKFVKLSINAILEDLQNQHWYPKKYKAESKQDKKASQVIEEEPIREEIPEHIKARAKEIAETGNPLTFILRTHQTMHIGDIGIATSLLLSATCQHVLNTDGIQPKLSGASGKGKSDCAKGMAHLIPPEWIIIASLSDKAIYYMADEMKPGTIIFCDDVNLSEDLEKIINRATTFYQTGTTHISVDTNRKKQVLRIPARLGWWLTSIDDDQSLQTLNRTFGGEVDESGEQDMEVMRMQISKAVLGTVGLPMNDDVITCREIIRDIKENNYIVKIPYAEAIQWRDVSNRRNLPMFLDLIKSFAVLRHRQREIDEEGHLIADLQDFVDAKELYTSRQQAQGTKLTASERNLCDVLRRNDGEMTYHELAIALKVGEDRITQILNGKGKGHDSGLKYKITGLHVERRTEKNTKGGYTTKNYVIMTAGYDPLAGYEEVVSLDDTNLPSYSKLTTNLPLKTSNGRRELTILTDIQSVECNSKEINISDDETGQEITGVKISEILPDSPHTQNEGKKGKFPVPDSENERVSSGKSEVRNGQQIAEMGKGKFPPKKVSSGKSDISIPKVHKWLSGWETQQRTKINSYNYRDAAMDYAVKHRVDLQEVIYITCKYAGIDEVFI